MSLEMQVHECRSSFKSLRMFAASPATIFLSASAVGAARTLLMKSSRESGVLDSAMIFLPHNIDCMIPRPPAPPAP